MMKSSKHTKGPWKTTGDDGRYISANDDVIIAALQLPFDDGLTALANAKLIASAPEMYEALQNLFQHIGKMHALSKDQQSKEMLFAMFNYIGAVLERVEADDE